MSESKHLSLYMNDAAPGALQGDALVQYRDSVVNRLLTGCAVIALLGVPASLSRIAVTGWMPLYGVHALLGSIALGTFLARRKLNDRVKLGIILALFYGVGISGLINLGLLGAGLWWLVVSSLLVSVLYSPRLGLLATTLSFLFVGLVGFGFVSGRLELPVDANDYVVSVASWATLIIATSVMPYFVFQAIATLQNQTARLVKQVEAQRDEISRLATRDQLTGMLMPRVIAERLEQAIIRSHRTGRRLAVMFLDLDRFKAVNDSYGHSAGDRVLQVLAERFSEVLRENDCKGRVGGDEFLFLLEDAGDTPAIAHIARRLVDAASAPVRFGDLSLEVGVSIGISLCPEDGSNAVSLRRAADEAMYEAKAAGRNGFQFSTMPAQAGTEAERGPLQLVTKRS